VSELVWDGVESELQPEEKRTKQTLRKSAGEDLDVRQFSRTLFTSVFPGCC
jgi:hypothetical protein